MSYTIIPARRGHRITVLLEDPWVDDNDNVDCDGIGTCAEVIAWAIPLPAEEEPLWDIGKGEVGIPIPVTEYGRHYPGETHAETEACLEGGCRRVRELAVQEAVKDLKAEDPERYAAILEKRRAG